MVFLFRNVAESVDDFPQTKDAEDFPRTRNAEDLLGNYSAITIK